MDGLTNGFLENNTIWRAWGVKSIVLLNLRKSGVKICDDIFSVLFLNVCAGITKSPLDLIDFVEHPLAGHQASKGQEEGNDHGDLAPEVAVETCVFQGGEVHQGGQRKGGYSQDLHLCSGACKVRGRFFSVCGVLAQKHIILGYNTIKIEHYKSN